MKSQCIFEKSILCLSVVASFLVLHLDQAQANAFQHHQHQSATASEPYSAPASSSYQHFDPYNFGYDVEDNYGGKQWRQERSSNPNEVHGSYGYRDKNGIYREVTYVADKNGFRANIKTNEPGVAGSKSPASVNLDSYYIPQPLPSPTPVAVAAAAAAVAPAAVPVYASKQQHYQQHHQHQLQPSLYYQ